MTRSRPTCNVLQKSDTYCQIVRFAVGLLMDAMK